MPCRSGMNQATAPIDQEKLCRDVRQTAYGVVETGGYEGEQILAGVGHPDAITVLRDFASAAVWRYWLAEILSVRHEQVIEGDPILAGQLGAQGLFSLIGSLGFHIAPPVADPMDMNIDADPRLLIPDCYHQIRSLSAHSRQGQ